MARGRIGRAVATLLVALGVLLAAAAAASAHSETLRSDPPNGGMVPEGRTSLTLWFDEPIGAAASTFQLRTLAGLEVDSSVDFENGADKVVVNTDPLARGQYILDWHALSLEDGHASSGTIVFGAGLRPDVVAAAGAGAPPVDLVILRWLDLGALLVALGALAVSGRVLGSAGGLTATLRDRVQWLGVLGGSLVVCAGLLTPLLRTRSAGAGGSEWLNQTWLTLTQTEWGRLWLLRELALLVAVAALLRWRRERGLRATTPRVALGGLVVAVLLQSWGGHAASLPTGSHMDALMSAGHVLASGVWVGGLAVLAVTLVPRMRRDPAWETRVSTGIWRAFSPMAAISSVVLVATGVYQAGHHVPDLGSLTSTLYGGAVAAKVVLVGAALAFAGVNTVRVNPAVADSVTHRTGLRLSAKSSRTLWSTLTAELVVLAAAVLAAAVLTSVPTAREVLLATRPTTPQATSAQGLFLTFESVPDGTGSRRLILRLRSTIQPEPAPVEGVDVLVTGPDGESATVVLDAVQRGRNGSEDSRFEGSTDALGSGHWRGAVSVHRTGLSDTTMSADWTVAPPADDQPGSLRTVSTILAGALLAGLGAALVLLRRRRARAGTPPPRKPSLEASSR